MGTQVWKQPRRWTAVAVTLGAILAAAAPALAAPAATVSASPVRTAPATAHAETSAYIDSVYLDLFDRHPDPAGMATWLDQLLNRRAPRVSVANAITSSEEFRSTLIVDLYAAYLGRQPDAAGLRFWLDKMARGWTIAQIGSGFIASDEYYAQAGSTRAGWAQKLYADVLGRGAGPDEVAFWVDQQAKGLSRPAAAMGFLLSTEHLSTVIDGYYQYLLGRSLDPTGQATWVGRLQAGGRDEDIIGGIIASAEYWDIAVAVPPFIVTPPTAPPSEAGIVFQQLPGHVPKGQRIVATVWAVDGLGRPLYEVTHLAQFSVDGPYACWQYCNAVGALGPHTFVATWQGFTTTTTFWIDPGPLRWVYIVPDQDTTVTQGEQVTFEVFGQDYAQNAVPPGPGALSVSDPASECHELTCTLNTLGWVRVTWTSSDGAFTDTVEFQVYPA